MGVAVPGDAGIGRAVLVEQCSCPTGYSGTSCEACAPGFQRNPTTGQCQGCNCNGHSNDCDPRTGRCKVSKPLTLPDNRSNINNYGIGKVIFPGHLAFCLRESLGKFSEYNAGMSVTPSLYTCALQL